MLATKLGETYMTGDLTALISFKQLDKALARQQTVSYFALPMLDAQRDQITNETNYGSGIHSSSSTPQVIVLHPNVIAFRNSPCYKTKCNLLRTFDVVFSNIENIKKTSNPVNLLYSDLIVSYKEKLLSYDNEFRRLIFKVLSHFADYTEYFYRVEWEQNASKLPVERVRNQQKKLDIFIWRLFNRLTPLVDHQNLNVDLNIQLMALADYIKHCSTPVMALQVMNTCAETLLQTKDLLLAKGKINESNAPSLAHSTHLWLEVMDEIAVQNTLPSLTDFFLAIYLSREETMQYLKHYTSQVLLNKEVEQRILESDQLNGHSKYWLRQYRLRIVKHYEVCVELLKRKVDNLLQETVPDILQIVELFTKLEFLLFPNGGYFFEFLTAENPFDGLVVKKEILVFLHKIFSVRRSPFVKKRVYVDTYVGYHYLSFIKLYNNYALDPPTLELCRLHLQVLLAFACNRNEKITMKFFQLRAMGFLVREVNLEYEARLKRERDKVDEQRQANKKIQEEEEQKQRELRQQEQRKVAPSPRNTVLLKPIGRGIPSLQLGNSSIKGNGNPILSTLENNNHSAPSLTTTSTEPFPTLQQQNIESTSPTTTTFKSFSPRKSPLEDLTAPSRTPSPMMKSLPKLSLAGITKTDLSTTSQEPLQTLQPAPISAPLPHNEESTHVKLPSPSPVSLPLPSFPSKLGGFKIPGLKILEPKGSSNSSDQPTAETTTNQSSSQSSAILTPIVVLPAKPNLSFKIPSLKIIEPKGGNNEDQPTAQSSLSTENKEDKRETEAPSSVALKPILKPIPKLSLKGISKTDLSGKAKEENIVEELEVQQPTQEVTTQQVPIDNVVPNFAEDEFYISERNNRKLYHNKEVHISILLLIFNLLFASNNTFASMYCDQYPLVNRKLNIPFILHLHINHPKNSYILSELYEQITKKYSRSLFILLKLLSTKLFLPSIYEGFTRIGAGAYGSVYKSNVSYGRKVSVAIKLMQLPRSIHDRCALYDIFTEVSILDKFKKDTRGCFMFDYGVDNENYWLVMKLYKGNLKDWRLKQTKSLEENLPLYLNIYTSILNTVIFLIENRVNHYDLKCENILIEPIASNISEDELWNQPTNIPNFAVCLGDFGVSKVYTSEQGGFTTRNRGTECIKSPEMLKIAYASQKTNDSYDRRKKVGANSASDVWSLGCLFFELLTGEFLFSDDDFARFFTILTTETELLPREKKALINNDPVLIEFLEFILIRNAVFRPTILDVIQKFISVRSAFLAQNAAHKLASPNYMKTPRNKQFLQKQSFYSVPEPIIEDAVEIAEDLPILSEIVPGFFIGNSLTAQNKDSVRRQNGITHQVDCFSSPSSKSSPDHVTTTSIVDMDPSSQALKRLQLPIPFDESPNLQHSFVEVVHFIKEALNVNGKILLTTSKSISYSAVFAIAYLMEVNQWNSFEALLFVREKNYLVKPPNSLKRQLLMWEDKLRSKQASQFKVYQCLCGSATFKIVLPFQGEVKSCSCKIEDLHSTCANVLGCFNFLDDMKKKSQCNEDSLMWAYTSLQSVSKGYEYKTTQCPPAVVRGKHVRKDWRVFRCRSCNFLTHATRNSGKEKMIAIVANFEIRTRSSSM